MVRINDKSLYTVWSVDLVFLLTWWYQGTYTIYHSQSSSARRCVHLSFFFWNISSTAMIKRIHVFQFEKVLKSLHIQMLKLMKYGLLWKGFYSGSYKKIINYFGCVWLVPIKRISTRILLFIYICLATG